MDLKTIDKRILFSVFVVLLFFGAWILSQDEVRNFVLEKRNALISMIASNIGEEVETLEFDFPEFAEEFSLEQETTEAEESEETEEPSVGEPSLAAPVLIAEPEVEPISLSGISEKISEISEKVEIISGKVAVLTGGVKGVAVTKDSKEIKIATIKVQIGTISEQIEILSQKVAELNKPSV